MSKYITFRVRIISTGEIIEELAKDSIDARCQVADMFDIDFEDTKLI
jgi:hypothetical protein